MINEPHKWPQQMWVIPRTWEMRLEREGDQWFLHIYGGPRFPVDAETAEKLSASIVRYYAKEVVVPED